MNLRGFLWGLALIGLAGCDPFGQPVTTLSVADGAVVIAAPEGYCIDRRASREQDSGSFVLLGNCGVMTSDTTGASQPVVLTALVSDPLLTETTPDPATLARYFKSQSGRASLSRDGAATSLSILQSQTRNGILYMKVRDTSDGGDPDLAMEMWRAMVPVDNRLAVLSVMTLATRPVSSDQALGVLRDFVSAVQTANAAAATGI